MPRSLQGRMLLLSAVATLMALALAGWAISGVLERLVIEGLDRRLDAELSLLASAVDTDGKIDRGQLQLRLGALEQGPGWRWRMTGPAGTVGSIDFPTLDVGPPRPPHAPEARRPDDDGRRIGAFAPQFQPREGRLEVRHRSFGGPASCRSPYLLSCPPAIDGY